MTTISIPTFVNIEEVRKLFDKNTTIILERKAPSANLNVESGCVLKNGTTFKCQDFKENLIRTVNTLQHKTFLSDVSLGCDNGYVVNMHRLVLASSSTYLHKVFEEFRDWKHSIIVLNGVNPDMLNLITQFMYTGKAEVPNDKIQEFIGVAKNLQIRGLESFYSLSSNQITCKSHQGQGHDENFVEHRDDRLSCLYSPVSDSGRSIWSDQTKYQLGGWERESRLNLLATLADLRSSSEVDERTPARLTPQTPSLDGDDDDSDSEDAGPRVRSKSSSYGPLAKYNSDNNENVPYFKAASDYQESRLETKTFPSRLSEPLSLINSNLSVQRVYGHPRVHLVEKTTSSRRSSINSSPIDFSNWKKELEARRKRLLLDSHPLMPPKVEEDTNVERNRNALMAVAKELSAASKTSRKTRTRGVRTASNRSNSYGSNWRSRQPMECEVCSKLFSNKFNLKQHIHNMHSVGGEVNCKECDKVVKNKWYLRRHMVTQHGAPLKKKQIKGGGTSANSRFQDETSSDGDEDDELH